MAREDPHVSDENRENRLDFSSFARVELHCSKLLTLIYWRNVVFKGFWNSTSGLKWDGWMDGFHLNLLLGPMI
jgi:hypothetical protein